MRIAQIAPLTEAVPPKLYGGTERVVHWLTEELVALGHDVTLFASGDSSTSAKLDATWPKALRLDGSVSDPNALHMMMLERVRQKCDDEEFDFLHFHLDYYPFSLFSRQPTPFLTTLHGRLDLPELQPVFTILLSSGDLDFNRAATPRAASKLGPHNPPRSTGTSLASAEPSADLFTPNAPPNHHRRRATATPNRNATNSEPSGASRAMLLKMLNGIPGFRPASIAPLTRWTVPFTASETSAMVDFGSGTASKPSWAKGAGGMSSLAI